MPSESSSPPLCSPDSHCLLSRIMLLSPTNAKTSATVVSIPMICHEAVPRGQEERLTQKDFKAARVPRQSGVGAPVHAILDRRGATRCISLYIFAASSSAGTCLVTPQSVPLKTMAPCVRARWLIRESRSSAGQPLHRGSGAKVHSSPRPPGRLSDHTLRGHKADSQPETIPRSCETISPGRLSKSTPTFLVHAADMGRQPNIRKRS
jgi:hypothetical protein